MNTMSRRQFGSLVGAVGSAAIASGLPGAALAKEAGGATPDLLQYVNPELRSFVRPIQQAFANNALSAATLAKRREMRLAHPPLAAPAYVERTIPGVAGSPPVRLYVINAGNDAAPPRPAILHTHGGGFVLFDAKASIASLQELALTLDCTIVTVDYRLAPETRFPGALEDNYAALKWLFANSAVLGVDRSRIAVMGESGGGGHAAMLAIAARDRGEVPLAYQALIYPMLDDRTGSTRKLPPQFGMVIWTPEDNRFGWTSLLGVPAGSRHIPYGAVPARVADLRGLPPTYIAVGSIDLFADEDMDYARRLIQAGVATELKVYPGAFHAFDSFPTTISRQFKTDLVAALRTALRPDSNRK